MVVTGWEIVGVLSTTAGLISFVAGSVERLTVVSDNIWEGPERLRQYHERVQNYGDRIEVWILKWGRTLPQLTWGIDGARRIENLQRSIEGETVHLRACLFGINTGDQQAARADQQGLTEWATFLNRRGDTLDDTQSRSLCSRFAFGLWRSTLLKESIDRLSKCVENLESASQVEFYRHTGASDWSTSPSTEAISEGGLLATRAERFGRTMDAVYTRLFVPPSNIGGLLFVQLPLEGRSYILSSFEEDQLDISFLVLADGTATRGYRVTVSYGLDEELSGELIAQIIQTSRLPPEPQLTLQLPLIHVLRQALALSSNGRELYMKATQCNRAEAALYIAAWAAIMFNSQWMVGLCACSVRPACVVGERQAPVFTKYRSATEVCSCRSMPNQMMALGVVLAEIAISGMIVVSGASTNIRFHAESLTTELDTDKLCVAVGQKTSILYRSAVAFCLSQVDILPDHPGSRGRYLRRAMECVVKPLYQYWDVLQKRRQQLNTVFGRLDGDAPTQIRDWRPEHS